MKHKFYEQIIAWAEGTQIQYEDSCGEWRDCTHSPSWDLTSNYRIKKEPVIEVKYFYIDYKYINITYVEFLPDMGIKWHLKVTYQDGKAIKAELPE